MKFKCLVIGVFFAVNSLFAQEWITLKAYQKATGENILPNGCWLKKDRKRQSIEWENANIFNLSQKNGNLKYTSISQIRDFYKWFDYEIKMKGHQINGIGVASIAAGQLSRMDNFFIRFFIVRNNEIVVFANEGSEKVFDFIFPLLKNVYFSEEILQGQKAKNWDIQQGKIEQCEVLEPLYQNLSKNAINRLEKMAKGKGIFSLAVPKNLKFEGEINDCEIRFAHGKNKLLPYYLKRIN